MIYADRNPAANNILAANQAGTEAGLKRSDEEPAEWIRKDALFLMAWNTGCARGKRALETGRKAG